MPDSQPPILVFADDWGRHPSSCQHLVGQLLNHYEVWWVNTIGMRRPRLDRASLGRGLEKLGQWLRPAGCRGGGGAPTSVHPRLHVVNPRMWPSFGSVPERRVNRDLLMRQLAPRLASMAEPPVALTTIPIVADLVGRLPVRRWIYYCVDDFAMWPGLDSMTLRAMEEDLVSGVDALIAVSAGLQERLGQRRQPIHLLTHGVDLEFWQGGDRGEWAVVPHGEGRVPVAPSGEDEEARPAEPLDGLQRPLIVFWGLIDRRIDIAFLARLAEDMTAGTIVLLGPESDPDPRLSLLARVVRHPAVPLAKLPEIAREAQVLIMPYADLPVTRAMQPLKLKEYLATGKPVVVRDLPANREWADALDLAGTTEAFSQAVRQRIETGLPGEQGRARLRLADESWAAKAGALERWLLGDDSEMTHEQDRPHPVEARS